MSMYRMHACHHALTSWTSTFKGGGSIRTLEMAAIAQYNYCLFAGVQRFCCIFARPRIAWPQRVRLLVPRACACAASVATHSSLILYPYDFPLALGHAIKHRTACKQYVDESADR